MRILLIGIGVAVLASGGGPPALRAIAPGILEAASVLDVCGGCAFSNIQAAIDAAAPDDRIRVSEGTYVGTLTVNKAVILEGGYSGPPHWNRAPLLHRTVLDGNNLGSVVTIINASPIVDGFVITHGLARIYGGGVYVFGSGASPIINGNVIVENAALDGGGVFIDDFATHAVVTNNVIAQNHASSSGAGVYLDFHSDTVLANNTIVDNDGGTGRHAIFLFNGPKAIVRNNIVAGHRVGIEQHNAAVVVDHNDVWNNAFDYVGVTPDDHSLSVDPLFASAQDYHLQLHSSLIDRGSVDDAPETDFEGDRRPLGSGIDIGADESRDPVGLPDLVALACSAPPATLALNEAFAMTDSVFNQGPGPAGDSRTQFYLSSDMVRNRNDRRLAAARDVPALAPGVESTGATPFRIPATTVLGSYFVLCCADDRRTATETNEKNNCVSSPTPTEIGAPDLLVDVVSDPPLSAAPRSTFPATDSVRNQGNRAAVATMVRYYLSADTSKGAGDIRLRSSRPVAALAPGASSAGSTTVAIPAAMPAGRYFVLACADDQKLVAESVETNNCRASANSVVVGAM
jgi:parallel beta-helix repeat protein